MAKVYYRLDSWVILRELEDLGLENTLQYDPYEDEIQNKQSFTQLTEKCKPMPDVRYYYIGAKILLPRGDQIVRGNVLARSQYANGNVTGRSHTNPILDTRMYQVEFTGGKVTELTTNVIAESLYAQCKSEGNECFLLDALVDYQKDNKAISISDKQITVWSRPVTYKTTAGWQICCQ